MNIEIFHNMLSNSSSSVHKIRLFFQFSCYYLRLRWGVWTGQIYFQWAEHKTKFVNGKEFLFELDSIIMNELKKRKSYHNYVDTVEKVGFEHIGYGCFVTRISNKLIILTQGDSSFFFFSPMKETPTLKIIFQSFAKVVVSVKIGDNEIIKFKMPTFSEREIQIPLPVKCKPDEIFKVIVSTSELWSLKYIDQNQINIPLGIGIKKIGLW